MNPLPLNLTEIKEKVSQLSRLGDPLEGYIATVEPLARIVQPYAAVWADCLKPLREASDDATWPDRWLPLVASHYTALIKAYSAYHNYLRLSVLCKSGLDGRHAASALLQTHAAADCYGYNVQLAAHHLQMCFRQIPRTQSEPTDNHFNGKKSPEPVAHTAPHVLYPMLPTNHSGDSINLNDSLGIGPTGQWQRQKHSANTLRRGHAQHVDGFLNSLGQLWWKLYVELRARRSQRGATVPSAESSSASEDGSAEDTVREAEERDPNDWHEFADPYFMPYYPQILGPGVGM